MSNNYYLQSAQDGLVFDIKVPVASGSPLQALVKKNEPNQQWAFQRVGSSKYFYIHSADQGLNVDIRVPVASGSPLQALVDKTEANQQWTVVDGPADKPQYFYLQSQSDNLVVDIKVPVISGSPLQALVKKNELNQLWTITPAPGNSFDPVMAEIYANDAFSFNIMGEGWVPGVQVSVAFTYDDQGGNSSTNEGSPFLMRADLGGIFEGNCPIDVELTATLTGQLAVKVTDSVNNQSKTGTYTWTGIQFIPA